LNNSVVIHPEVKPGCESKLLSKEKNGMFTDRWEYGQLKKFGYILEETEVERN